MTREDRAPWWAFVLLFGGALAIVVAGGAFVVGKVMQYTTDSLVKQEDILGDDRVEIEGTEQGISGPLNFLILGLDEQRAHQRTDAVIIAHVNADLSEVYLISVPRDLSVEIPDCGWGGGPCEFKLNHAGTVGDRDYGLNNLNETLYKLTGVRFHGAATANFEGFIDLIDVVGEIELCLWHEIASNRSGKVFPKGCAYYGKEEALFLVRERKQWDWPSDWAEGRGGDYGRSEMQQQAVKSILVEARKQGYHKDPVKAIELLNGFGDQLTVDLGEVGLTDLVSAMRDVDPSKMTSLNVPSSPEPITRNGAPLSIVRIHEGEERVAADALWDAIGNDTLDQWTTQYPKWVSSDS
jgi:LCP family protein required for cell wall assembly